MHLTVTPRKMDRYIWGPPVKRLSPKHKLYDSLKRNCRLIDKGHLTTSQLYHTIKTGDIGQPTI